MSGLVKRNIDTVIGGNLQIGNQGPRIKQNNGVIENRNAADDAFAIVRGADPVDANDLLTKQYFEANNASADSIVARQFSLTESNKVTTGQIPDNSIINKVIVHVTAAYDNGATMTMTRTGGGATLINPSDVVLDELGFYVISDCQVDWGSTGAGAVSTTFTGAPTVGEATVYIHYYMPTSID